ncbi:MAG: hypothetical protein H9893_03620 [Candidatus Niameybacter stercoravium]|nr:hypothetical protein [Candidatus Niameybacter stercoravium]
MRFFEELQYKARTLLYEKDRQRAIKKQKQTYKSSDKGHNFKENSKVKDLMDSLDEMDAYLEEKVDEWNFKIKK